MIKEVTMYRAECDECGDGTDGDYYAWADRSQAIDEWIDSDGLVFDEERCVHRDCIPYEACPALANDYPNCTEGHTWENGGECGEGCGRHVRDLLAAVVMLR